MVKIGGVDIPSGLEAAFAAIFQFTNALTQGAMRVQKTPISRYRSPMLSAQSLFVRWQSLWGSFDSTRRDAWQAYWATLPFGPHDGLDGWPGSGYSAFVYVNAPRFASGQDLLLDPPYTNLLYNADFALGSLGWQTFAVSIGAGVADFNPAPNLAFFQTATGYLVSLTAGRHYRMGATIGAGSHFVGITVAGFILNNPAGAGTVHYDFVAPSSASFVFQIYTGDGFAGLISNPFLYDIT